MSITAKHFFPSADTPKSSEKILTISGINVHVYGLNELTKRSKTLAVLYHCHGRTRTYTDSEALLNYVLHYYRSQNHEIELIGVAFDCRNHGSRIVDISRQGGWPENETHGQDMISDIFGNAQDYINVAEFLPTYIPEYDNFFNIMSGVSLGGHTTWRLANVAPSSLFQAYAPIIGCPALSRMLIARLGIKLPEEFDEKNIAVQYKDIMDHSTPEQRKHWPPALASIVYENDKQIANLNVQKTPYLVLNGELDPLVPNKYTLGWIKHNKSQSTVKFHAQDNAGHQCTPEMVDRLSKWVSEVVSGASKL